jgi:hypothetical protein
MGTHDDNERDPMIAGALGQVPVPPRPADFLDRLDDALDAVDEERRPTPATATPTTRPGETVPVDLTDPRSDNDVADLPARRRQKSGRRYRVLAAAASVAVVLGGVAVLAGDDGTTTVSPAGTGTTQPSTFTNPQAEALNAAMRAVMDWSKAVGDRDAERAWSLMGPLSQAYLTDQGGWDEMFASMGEGSFGKWQAGGMPTSMEGSAADEDVRAVSGENREGAAIRAAFLPETEDAAVVTLSGVFELEGNREKALDSFPLTREGDGPWVIEPFAFGPGETMAEFVMPGLSTGGGLEDVERNFMLEVAAVDAEEVAVAVWARDPAKVGNAAGEGAFRAMKPAGPDRWTDLLSEEFPGGSLYYLVVARGAGFFTAHPVEIFVKAGEPDACPNIGFTPNSDDVASGISIVSSLAPDACDEADRVVRHVHEDMKHNFFDGPRYFTALGYECTVRTESEGLESGLYRCTDGATLVSWRKT